jgi:hypothetical protein
MKLTYEEVQNRFKEQGFTLIDGVYIGVRSKMRCVCKNGHEIFKTVRHLDRKCAKCAAIENSSRTKLSYEEVAKEFEARGCKLISTEYKNAREHLDYICSCGNVSKITLSNFKKGVNCKDCGLRRLSQQFKHDIDYVRKKFSERGFILLSENYINSKQKLDYICSCGNISSIMYLNFLKGKSCVDCGIKKNSGVNHPKYNPELTDAVRKRHIIGYERWRQFVFERDNYSCLKCGNFYQVELNAHHIQNFSQRKDLATDLSNGATLCRDCHINFHKSYGYENNNNKQFDEWLCS